MRIVRELRGLVMDDGQARSPIQEIDDVVSAITPEDVPINCSRCGELSGFITPDETQSRESILKQYEESGIRFVCGRCLIAEPQAIPVSKITE